MDTSNGADNFAGDQAQQVSGPIYDAIQHVKVINNNIQVVSKLDNGGRRYLFLENLPLDTNYVANWINSGREFA